jgi:hypothetical protein
MILLDCHKKENCTGATRAASYFVIKQMQNQSSTNRYYFLHSKKVIVAKIKAGCKGGNDHTEVLLYTCCTHCTTVGRRKQEENGAML